MTRTPDPSPLDASLGYWLRSASNRVTHGLSQKLVARDVTAAEWVLLRMIYAHDVGAPNRLARDLGMTKGAISKLVDRLAGKGLASKAAMTSDRRHQDVWLTPVGRALVPELAALADANEVEYFGHLSVGERGTLDALLRNVAGRPSVGDQSLSGGENQCTGRRSRFRGWIGSGTIESDLHRFVRDQVFGCVITIGASD